MYRLNIAAQRRFSVMKGRSLLAALMALCLFFSLAACGKTGAGEQPGDTAAGGRIDLSLRPSCCHDL